MSCGEDLESEEFIVIDPSYLTSSTTTASTTTTFPPVSYPIQFEDVYEIKVGESVGYEDIEWNSVFKSEFSVSTPAIIEGKDSICVVNDGFSVFGSNPGTCIAEYPSSNSGLEGSVFITFNVSEG